MPECAATAAGCDRCSRTCSGTRRNTPRRTAQTRFDRPTAAKTPPLTVLVTATGGDFSSPTTDRGSIRRTEEVFDPGFTTREDGTGYGLDIVREVVESHGWTIGVRRDGTDPACPDDVTVPDGACFVVGGPDSDAADADEPWIDG